MKVKLCDVSAAATEKLPEHTDDKSGVGAHYVDAYLKPMNTKLEDGSLVKCKRRGLKITLAVGAKKGEGLLRRFDVSRDPVAMLQAALQKAAQVGPGRAGDRGRGDLCNGLTETDDLPFLRGAVGARGVKTLSRHPNSLKIWSSCVPAG